ncbi:MAG: SusC/RagA family TonB-linked outer membrane protein [Bacteroidales bacterium]
MITPEKTKRVILPWKISWMIIFLLVIPGVLHSQRIITGKVTGADTREGLPGANVVVKGTTTGAVSNLDGSYQIQVASGRDILVFSFVGYQTQEIVVGDQTVINVTLSPEVRSLEEIVVMGYSEKKKTEIASAVSVLDEGRLRDVISSNMGAMLQGKVAGVQVVNSSGYPGAGSEIRIRGTSTLNGNSEPLYVVDGIIAGNGDPGIDPALIENVTILKDAGATGLYGSRANGGVIILTTKRGSSKPQYEFSSSVGLRTPDFGKVQMMNGAEYYDAHQGLFTDTTGYIDKVRFLNNYPKALRERNFDWVNTIFKPAMVQNYYLSASGGSEKYKYFLGASYFNEDGTFMNTNFEKISLRSNNSYTFSDRINLNGNIDLSVSRGKSYDYMDMYYTWLSSPWDSAYDASGKVRYVDQSTSGWYSRDKINPIHSIQNSDYGYQSAAMNLNLGLNIKITDWLTFSSTAGLSYWNGLSTSVINPQIAGPLHGIGSLSRDNNYGYGALSTNLLRFAKSFGDHNLSGLVGGEFSYGYSDTWGASAEGLMQGYRTFNTTSKNFKVSGAYGENTLESFLSQINYNFREKYFLTGSYRVDANSKFAPGHKTAVFPTISGAWIISREDFMSTVNAVNMLKLRLSFGYTGNEAIDPGKYNALYSLNSNYNGQVGAYPYQLPNLQLTWEKARQLDLGIDLSLLKRIDLTLDLYSNTTMNLLFVAQQAYSIGYEFRWENSGEIYNKGFEIGISSTNIKTSDFTWTTDFNFSFNANEVGGIARAKPRILNGIEQRLENGKPLYAFYLPVWKGVNPNNGNPVWEKVVRDANGEITDRVTTYDYSAAEAQYAGSAMPKYYGGFTSVVQYKRFSLSFNLSYLGGNKVFNNDRSQFDTDGNEPRMNFVKPQPGDIRWSKPGDKANLPRMGSNSLSYYPSTRFLEDGSYLKLRNITLSYELPTTWFRHKITGITLVLSGDNIYTLTKYTGFDPEATLRITDWSLAGVNDLKYPLNHQYNFSVKVKF